MRRIGFAFAVVSAALSMTACAQAGSPKNADPVLGDRIVRAVASQGRLWLAGDGPSGARGLVSFSLAGGDRRVPFADGVVDVCAQGDEIWVLRKAPGASAPLLVSIGKYGRYTDTAPFSLRMVERPIALACDAGEPIVLTSTALLRYRDGRWTRLDLRGRLGPGVARVAEPRRGGVLYVGFNMGEWGGGLQRVDLATGEVSEIGRYDPKSPESSHLSLAGATVTAVIADPTSTDCVLVADGLLHLGMSEGRVARVCDQRVELVFERPYLEPRLNGGGFIPETEAVFGLGSARDGSVWAVTWKAVYKINGSTVRSFALPEMTRQDGIFVSRAVPGVLLVRTDLNRAHSMSGYTPLIVPLG